MNSGSRAFDLVAPGRLQTISGNHNLYHDAGSTRTRGGRETRRIIRRAAPVRKRDDGFRFL